MKELGLFAEREYFIFPGSELKDHRELVTVRSGLGVTLLFRGGEWGRLKSGTVFSGEFFVGQERVYGRFTEARTPEGSTYRVCLELFGGDGKRGLEREPGSGTDTANVLSGMMMDAVLEFGAVD
jgi:serine/threonine-protein kinase